MTEAEKFCEENNVKFRLSNIGENIGVVALEYINMLEKENKISEEVIIGEQQEINELRKENEELKAKLYSDSKNVFAELNDETAKSNAELLDMVDDLKSQIKGFENDFDYQNKVINKYKEDLKKLRVAYIQAQVANVISGTDFESILKSVLNGEFGT